MWPLRLLRDWLELNRLRRKLARVDREYALLREALRIKTVGLALGERRQRNRHRRRRKERKSRRN